MLIKIIRICFILFLFLTAIGLNETSAADSHFGVTCTFKENADSIIKDLDLMKEAGIGWRRVNLNWSRYEKNKSYLDKAILEANKRNINVLVMIIMGEYSVFPEQGVKNKKFRKTIQDFEKFVAEVSERYDGDSIKDAPGSPVVTYWQIENEETGPGHFWKRKKFSKLPGPANKYVEVLKVAYKAIKANQPQAKVVIGGLGSYDKNNYLEGILKAEGGKYFDILDFHIYLDFPSFWRVIKVEKRVTHFHELLKKYGLSKPIWATEMTTGQQGFGKKVPQKDKERVLAELVVKRYVVLLSEGVEKAFWKYYDTPKVPGGLLDANLSPRLAYKAYGTMIQKIGGFSGVEDMSKGDLKVFKFRFDKKEIFVVWAEQKQTADLGLGEINVTDIFGKTIAVKGPFSADHIPMYVEKKV
jgi:hypothetical protein